MRDSELSRMEALHGIAAPIFAVNLDGIVTLWNRKMQVATGISDERISNHFLSEFLTDKTQWDSVLQTLRDTNDFDASYDETSCTIELYDSLGNKTTRSIKFRVVPNFSIDYKILLGAVCFVEVGFRDEITIDGVDHREERYIEVKEKAKAETEQKLTAFFAHELRNPLSALDSALNAILHANYDEVTSLIPEMQACIKVMSSIMNNLVDVRKFEEGTVTLTNAPVSLRTLLAEVHRTLLPSVKSGVLFEVVCNTADRDWVRGDSRRLQQILINITANAIKYTLGGSVTLTATWDQDNVVFTCIDTGSGISGTRGQTQPDSLYQCGAPSRGLELAVARHLVKLYDGKIEFTTTPGMCCCSIHLPLTLCESHMITSSIEKSQVIEAPLHILIVDDIMMNRTMMKRRMKRSICSNCIVSEASTGEEALQMCGVEKFDIIIVDQYMEEAGGVMVGTDVIYTLRRMGVDSIIIGCSGNDLDELFKDAGVDLVWPKPIPTNEEIIVQIRDALAKNH